MSREQWEVSDNDLETAFLLTGWKRYRDDLDRISWVLELDSGNLYWPPIDNRGKRRPTTNRVTYNYITGVTKK